jgi:hypothetical protein
MSENQKRILQMLAEGKISVDEASRLLSLVRDGQETTQTSDRRSNNPKYLYVKVEPKEGYVPRADKWGNAHHDPGKVNVRIPVSLVRAGMKFTSLIPPQAADDVNRALKEKGIAFDVRNLKGDDMIEELIAALSDTEIDVDSEEATVRIHAE